MWALCHLMAFHGSDDNFFILKIRLNSDFRALSTVRVIKDEYKAELDSLHTFDFNPNK